MASMDWIRKRYREDSIVLYAKDFLLQQLAILPVCFHAAC